MNVVDYKCPNCTATLKFNPNSQKWDCDYCRTSFSLEDLKINDVKYQKVKSKPLKNLDVYTCKNCGAKIMTDVNTTATFCVYCKSTAIIKNRLVDAYEPDKIIPFKKTKEEAIKAFKNVGVKKILMPKEFSDPKNIEQIRGIYIPFWLFDIDCKGSINSTATKVKCWSTINYTYTKTDHYKVARGGDSYFDNIPVDASQNFDDAIMNSIEPFNYKEMQDFNYGYLSGFYAEKYDTSDDELSHIASSRAKNSMIDYLKNDIKGYTTSVITTDNIMTDVSKGEYVLFPVWMLNIKYKDGFRTFAMNGQTGKMVGNIPIDKFKAFLLAIIMFIVVFLLVMGTFIIFGGYRL